MTSRRLSGYYDDRPVPKVIDFGVAKAVEQRLTEKTVYTQFGTLVGTFEYMSPEQAEMNAFGVDTRSDIYALGVLLYELLTGTTPLERKRLREAALGEVVRLIKEEEAPRPSVRLSTSGALAKVAAARQTDPGKLSRLVRGELDWVVMRCLEKDRTRRYDTASALARDVERYLKDEQVEARPPSAWYRLSKTARRNKVALTTAAVVLAALVVGTVVSTWQALRANEARRAAEVAAEAEAEQRREAVEAEGRAQIEKDNASAALEFINQGILSQANPHLGADPDITLRTVVDQIAENLEKGQKQPPLVEASIRHALGNIYTNLERYPEAAGHFKRAYTIRLSKLGEGHPDTIRTMVLLGYPPLWWNSEDGTRLNEKSVDEGRRLALRAWALAKEVLGPDDFSTLVAMRDVGQYHTWAKQPEKARPLYHQFLEDCRRARGPGDPLTISAYLYLAWHYRNTREYDKARNYALRGLQLRRERYGEDHYLTYLAIECLAELYSGEQRYAEAEPLCRDLIDGFRRHVGDRSLSYLYSRSRLAFILNRQGKHKEAAAEYEKMIPLLRQASAYHRHRPQWFSLDLTAYGDTLNKLGRYADARSTLGEALTIREKGLGPTNLRYQNTRSILGETLIGLKRYDEAESHLMDAYRVQVRADQAESGPYGVRNSNDTLERLVKLYDAWDKPVEAAKWRKELEARKAAVKKS